MISISLVVVAIHGTDTSATIKFATENRNFSREQQPIEQYTVRICLSDRLLDIVPKQWTYTNGINCNGNAI